MKVFKKLALILCATLLLMSVAALTACNNNKTPSGGGGKKIEVVDLDKTDIVLEIDESDTVTATITPEDATEKINWVLDEDGDDCVTLTVSDDKLTATVTAKAAGTTTLFANVKDDEGCSEVSIKVNKPLGTSKLKLGGATENFIEFYDSNQYVVDVSSIMAHDIVYRGDYSVTSDGLLNLAPTQCTWAGLLVFNTQFSYKQKKSGANLVVSGKEPTSGDIRNFITVKFTEENLTTLGLSKIAPNKIKEVANIAVLNTDDKVFVKTESGSVVNYTLNVVSGTAAIDLSKYFTLVDAEGETPTEEEIQYQIVDATVDPMFGLIASLYTGTAYIEGNTVLALKSGNILVRASSVDKPEIKQDITVTYPEGVEGFTPASDTHFEEDIKFSATGMSPLVGEVTRNLTFYPDGTMLVEMLGKPISYGYYKLDKTEPTKITMTQFVGTDIVGLEVPVTGTGNKMTFKLTLSSTDYNFVVGEIEKAKLICKTTDDIIEFYDDGTYIAKGLISVKGKWSIESDVLKMADADIGFGMTGKATVTTNDDGSLTITYKAVADGAEDSAVTNGSTLSKADFDKLKAATAATIA